MDGRNRPDKSVKEAVRKAKKAKSCGAQQVHILEQQAEGHSERQVEGHSTPFGCREKPAADTAGGSPG